MIRLSQPHTRYQSLQAPVRSDQERAICGHPARAEAHEGNIGESGGITTFPYSCAFLLKRFLETWQRIDFSERRRQAKKQGIS